MRRFGYRAAVAALLGLAAFLSASNESEAGYDSGDVTVICTTNPLAAGGVTGSVGVLGEEDPDGEGTTAMESRGVVGAHWNGSQYQHKDGAGQGGLDILHQYWWDSWDDTETASFTVSSSVSVSGSADPLKPPQEDPQWWWNSSNSVTEDRPTTEAYVPGVGYQALTITWTADVQADVVGGDKGFACPTPPPGYATPVPSSNNQGNPSYSLSSFTTQGVGAFQPNGESRGETEALPNVAGARVTVHASWAADAMGCVDNANVHDDRLALAYRFESDVD